MVLALLAGPVAAIDQGFHYVSILIPVAIDGQPVHCPLYLKLEIKTDNMPINQYAAAPMEKAQTMFVTAVEAVRKSDATHRDFGL